MSLASAQHAGISPTVYRRRWWILVALCLSLLIIFVGNTSLNVAIPTLSRELHATESQLQWVIAAYSLVFAGLLFTAGAIGDRYGRKGALQFGLVVFLISCVGATLSHSTWQLIACRGLMGIGAAFIMPSTLSILVNVFPPDERTKAISAWAAVAGCAGMIGPVASGFLLTHFWYGSVFLVNVPIVATAFIAGWFLLPKSRDPEEAQLDPFGSLLSIIGIVSIVYGLIEAPDHGWLSTPTLIAFGVGIVVLTVFVLWELHTDEPMLDMRYFRNPAYSTGTGGMVLIFMSMFGVMFLVTQYLQLVRGYTPLGAAIRLLPNAPLMILIAPCTPRLSERFGAHRTVAAGMVCVGSGLLLLRMLDLNTPFPFILGALMLSTAGFGLAMSPMTASIMSAVPPRRAGAGSATNDASRELGAALGVAVMGSLAASKYTTAVDPITARLPAQLRDAARGSIAGAVRAAGALPAPAARALTAAADAAFVNGLHLAVTAGGLLAFTAAGIMFRYFPHVVAHEGAMAGPREAMEDAAELGLGGIPPVFADQPAAGP
jgi:EmrB/QacA subfamily drug resistance transporter